MRVDLCLVIRNRGKKNATFEIEVYKFDTAIKLGGTARFRDENDAWKQAGEYCEQRGYHIITAAVNYKDDKHDKNT